MAPITTDDGHDTATVELDLSGDDLEKLQRDTFGHFLQETNARNWLVPDSPREDAPSSIAAFGLALAYPAGVRRDFRARSDAIKRVLATLS
jgi:hypothetical protein